jgi:hypothetical protein
VHQQLAGLELQVSRGKVIALLLLVGGGSYVYGVMSGWANAKEDSKRPVTEQYDFTKAQLWSDIKEAWRNG